MPEQWKGNGKKIKGNNKRQDKKQKKQ